MAVLIGSLFGWMLTPLKLICLGVVAIFFIFTALHIIRFILELIPFL